MVSIFIKSYNRAYYLDRCLGSIFKNVSGNYNVVILDDGTPQKYLDKISSRYSSVKILHSENYQLKFRSVEENIISGKSIDSMEIPTQLWVDAVSQADDYVLVTEDDVWFVDTVDLDEIVSTMKTKQIDLVKLGWLGNKKDEIHLKTEKISNVLERTIPQNIFTGNEFLMELILYNKFKFFTILKKFGLVNQQTRRKYWALNSILMGLYHKDYWLHIWKDAYGKVDEKQQLRNAAVWYHKKRKNQNLIARTRMECMKTTFQSSSTNSYHSYGFAFDVNYFNYIMNEAWYNGQFDVMQNYPNDFSTEYFERFFDEKLDKAEFRKWVEKFKMQYRNNGAQVD